MTCHANCLTTVVVGKKCIVENACLRFLFLFSLLHFGGSNDEVFWHGA